MSLSYFISDLHLGAAYIEDARAHEARVVDFLRSIEDKADTLYMLGDVLDYWFEYRTAVPRGHVRFFGQLARMADKGVRLVWFTGNHDIWLFDYLRDEIGIEIIDTADGGLMETIDGTLFYLAHGDNFGPPPLSYRLLRGLFHNRFCQKLYSGIHPRWSVAFAHGWSSHSRKAGMAKPFMSEAQREGVEHAAEELCIANPALRYIVLGRHHVEIDTEVRGADCRLIVLGSWIDGASYAVFDGKELRLEKIS